MPRSAQRRRRLSLTSLIDVIFLLLLFFMLTSTFSRFAEVPITAAQAGGGESPDGPPLFLRLGPERISLNGDDLALTEVAAALPDPGDGTRTLLVSLADDVSSQRLTDLLGVLRGVDGIAPTVLGGG